MFEELIEHVDDCRRPARRDSLPGAPSVDPLDQPGLDPNVDICGFPFHTGEVGGCRAPPLDNPGQKIDRRTTFGQRLAAAPWPDFRIQRPAIGPRSQQLTGRRLKSRSQPERSECCGYRNKFRGVPSLEPSIGV
jgi:hypothetical protein